MGSLGLRQALLLERPDLGTQAGGLPGFVASHANRDGEGCGNKGPLERRHSESACGSG